MCAGRMGGGASTGPRTPGGRQTCAEVKTVHGHEARALRAIRDEKLRELRHLERFMKTQGIIKYYNAETSTLIPP